jgi:3-carboxy-cis,cis-muconate cycloisomerase
MSTALSPLLAPMLSSSAMRAVCDDAMFLQNMLDFEAALARAEAATRVIPPAAGHAIANACRAETFDRRNRLTTREQFLGREAEGVAARPTPS